MKSRLKCVHDRDGYHGLCNVRLTEAAVLLRTNGQYSSPCYGVLETLSDMCNMDEIMIIFCVTGAVIRCGTHCPELVIKHVHMLFLHELYTHTIIVSE